jgi:hypothetical protein
MSLSIEGARPADQPCIGPEEIQAVLAGSAALLLLGLALFVSRVVAPPTGPDWPAAPGGPRPSRR